MRVKGWILSWGADMAVGTGGDPPPPSQPPPPPATTIMRHCHWWQSGIGTDGNGSHPCTREHWVWGGRSSGSSLERTWKSPSPSKKRKEKEKLENHLHLFSDGFAFVVLSIHLLCRVLPVGGSLQWPNSLVVCCSLPGTNIFNALYFDLASAHTLSFLPLYAAPYHAWICSIHCSFHPPHSHRNTDTRWHSLYCSSKTACQSSAVHIRVQHHIPTHVANVKTDADEFKNDKRHRPIPMWLHSNKIALSQKCNIINEAPCKSCNKIYTGW